MLSIQSQNQSIDVAFIIFAARWVMIIIDPCTNSIAFSLELCPFEKSRNNQGTRPIMRQQRCLSIIISSGTAGTDIGLILSAELCEWTMSPLPSILREEAPAFRTAYVRHIYDYICASFIKEELLCATLDSGLF